MKNKKIDVYSICFVHSIWYTLPFESTVFSVLHCLYYDLWEQRCSGKFIKHSPRKFLKSSTNRQRNVNKIARSTCVACLHSLLYFFALFILINVGGLWLFVLLLVAQIFHLFFIYLLFLYCLLSCFGWEGTISHLHSLHYLNNKAILQWG